MEIPWETFGCYLAFRPRGIGDPGRKASKLADVCNGIDPVHWGNDDGIKVEMLLQQMEEVAAFE